MRKRQINKICLVLMFIISTIIGIMIWRKSDVRDTHGFNDRRVKVSVDSSVDRQGNLFQKTHREVLELLGNKIDNHTDEDVEETMMKRKNHVETVCALLGKKDITIKHLENQLTFYENINTLYCPVPKVASKFLGRILHLLNFGDFSSPFDFKSAQPKLLSKVMERMTKDERTIYMEKVKEFSLSIIFARNPYKRIFSSYVDKFIAPNYKFWNYAKMIQNQTAGCGKDLKFSELIKYLISTSPDIYEDHFKPVTTHCDICNVEYLVIGKVETFKTDIYHILNITNSRAKIMFKDFLLENSIHYIIYNSMRTYDMLSKLLTCATYHQIYQRLWRQLQISGMIETDYSYPLSPVESKSLSLTSLTNLLLDGFHRSTSGARSNSQDAFLQAYREVPLEDLEKLRLKFLKDFIMFDYESKPSNLFSRRDSMSYNKRHFDFFDLLEKA